MNFVIFKWLRERTSVKMQKYVFKVIGDMVVKCQLMLKVPRYQLFNATKKAVSVNGLLSVSSSTPSGPDTADLERGQ